MFFFISWIRGSHNTDSRNSTLKIISWIQMSVIAIRAVIMELCYVTSKLPLHWQTPSHFEMNTMRHYFRKFLFTCGYYHISRYFSGHLESGQPSNKLASKTCRMFLGRTKTSKNQARKLTVKSGPNNISLKENVSRTKRGFCEITS